MTNPLVSEIQSAGLIQQFTIQLPTRGVFYAEDVLVEGADVDEIGINPLSIMDENTFKDPFLIASGRAIPLMIKKICPEVVKPDELSDVDIEAILLGCRISSYGPNLQIEDRCRNQEVVNPENPDQVGPCNRDSTFDLNLNDFILRYGELSFMDMFWIEFDDIVKQKVQLRPIPYGLSQSFMKEIMQAQLRYAPLIDVPVETAVLDDETIENYTRIAESMHDVSLRTVVNSILFVETASGKKVYDHDLIKEWMNVLPAQYMMAIKGRIDEINKKLRELSEVVYNCPSCGHENHVYVQMDPQKLFTSAEASVLPTKSSAPSKRTGKKGKPQSRISQR